MLSRCRQCQLKMADVINVADAVTGFLAESRVSLDIYLVIFYVDIYMEIFSCSTTVKMFPLHPPPEQVIPIIIIVATNDVQACGKHRFGCGNTLLLAGNAHGFGGLLHRLRTGTRQTHHLFCSQ